MRLEADEDMREHKGELQRQCQRQPGTTEAIKDVALSSSNKACNNLNSPIERNFGWKSLEKLWPSDFEKKKKTDEQYD
jgi:hypothetical protein